MINKKLFKQLLMGLLLGTGIGGYAGGHNPLDRFDLLLFMIHYFMNFDGSGEIEEFSVGEVNPPVGMTLYEAVNQ